MRIDSRLVVLVMLWGIVAGAAGIAQPQGLTDRTIAITNGTGRQLVFSLNRSADDRVGWQDIRIRSKESKAYKDVSNAILRIATQVSGGKLVRYYTITGGQRYRIGVDATGLYDLREIREKDQPEVSLKPLKESNSL